LPTRTIHGLEGPSQARDISNDVTGDVPLGPQGIESLAGRNLRTRFWNIPQGGVVPIHDHADRPAMFTIASGEIYEYSSLVEDRILHRTGGLALEEGAVAHWWENEGAETVHLIAFDVHRPDGAETGAQGRPDQDAMDLPETAGAELDLLGAVDLGAHFGDGTGAGLVLSTYRATLAPGGVLPDFSDAGEPLQVFVWDGSVTEHHSDDGARPLANRTGSTIAGTATAWWENTGDAPAILYFGVVEPAVEVEGVERIAPLAHGSHGD
ncbi:MAG: hypothetical protein AAF390_14460, partial [Pseudomonadota bacterium]